MTNIDRLQPKPIILRASTARSFVIGIAVVLGVIWQAVGATPTEIVDQIRQSCTIPSSIEGFSVFATSVFALDPEFVKLNQGIEGAKREGIAKYQVTLRGEAFKIVTEFQSKDGERGSSNAMVYDGKQTMVKFSKGSALSVKAGAKMAPDNSMPLGSILFLPYGFLQPLTLSPGEPGKLPIVTLAALQDNSLWSHLAEKLTVLEARKTPELVRIRVDHDGGGYSIVGLDAKNGLFPRSIDIFSSKGNLLLRFDVIRVSFLEVENRKIPYAQEATFSRYAEGFKISERHVTIEKVEGLKNSEETFSFDPASVDVIFDEDSRTSIKVPK